MSQQFVHLRLHSEFSIVDGLIRIDPLMDALRARGMNAVAVTDFCNFFAAVKVFESATAAGIKPILGATLANSTHNQNNEQATVVVLCKNAIGYRNLTCLISKAYQEGQSFGIPLIQDDWLREYREGLIVLSGGRLSPIGVALLAGHDEEAYALAEQWNTLFPQHFYLEIQRTGRKDEARYNEKVVQLADALHIPLVATNDVCFLNEDDFEAHEARVCIHEGVILADPNRQKRYVKTQYLRSAAEMVALFKDLPQAIENTVEIAKRCTVHLELGKNYLPTFPIPQDFTVEAYLSNLAKEGLALRLQRIFKDEEKLSQSRHSYDERLRVELDVINSMGFAGYFLIVADFIQWARENGVPVGPGRGSGAGSLVAYALKITDLDPLQYDLLFERFLNPERVSMPDFDIDFCMAGRDRVIDYVAEKYGRQAVSQIITFGTMAAKAVIRDVGRVFGHPYGFVDKIAKLIPFEIGMTLDRALEEEPELKQLYQNEEEVKELIDLARKLEGITRNAGKHAGGVVIAPSQLTDFTAIYCEPDSQQLVSQFDKDDVEAVGLVKFDFLGLRTLTIIDWALQIINAERTKKEEPPIDIGLIPMDDAKTFDLLKACETTAVFQLESRGMKDLIFRLQPDCFEDVIALVALFRPGPLQSGMVDDFIDRKHGIAKVEYPHPDLEPILKPTYGVILYQEQVMQIAQVLACYTLGSADLLRRAMGKKKPEEMAKQRAIFTEGALVRAVPEKVATGIFDLMEKFAGYGFNKSHSAAYALVAYQTAWLKAHYPAAFMAAVLSADMDNTDKMVIFIDECHKMELKLEAPSVNDSYYPFTVADEKTLRYGLGAIKGVGESAIGLIVKARESGGAFRDLFDFCERLDLRKVNRRLIEILIKSGAMDCFAVDRAILMASLEKALKMADQTQKNQSSGQGDLFSLFTTTEEEALYVDCKAWSYLDRIEKEKETLGFYLTGHPATPYCIEFASLVTPLAFLNAQAHRGMVCVLITGIRQFLTKRGKKLYILACEDPKSKLDIVVFSEVYEQTYPLVQIGKVYLIEGELGLDKFNNGVRLTASKIYAIEAARTRFANCLQLSLKPEHASAISLLESVLKNHPGDFIVQVHYINDKVKALLHLGQQWRVSPSESLIAALHALLGEEAVALVYH